MIEGGWGFVTAAYAVAVTALVALALIVVLRLGVWAKRARALDKPE